MKTALDLTHSFYHAVLQEIDLNQYRVFYRCVRTINTWWTVGRHYEVIGHQLQIHDDTGQERKCLYWNTVEHYGNTLFVRIVTLKDAPTHPNPSLANTGYDVVNFPDELDNIIITVGYYVQPLQVAKEFEYLKKSNRFTEGEFYPLNIQEKYLPFIDCDNQERMMINLNETLQVDFHTLQLAARYTEKVPSSDHHLQPLTESQAADFFGYLHDQMKQFASDMTVSEVNEEANRNLLIDNTQVHPHHKRSI